MNAPRDSNQKKWSKQERRFHNTWVYFVTHVIPVIAIIISTIALYETNESDNRLITAQLQFENEIAIVAASVETYRSSLELVKGTIKSMISLRFINYSIFYDCSHKEKVSDFIRLANTENKKRLSEIENLVFLYTGTRFKSLFGKENYDEVQCMTHFNLELYKQTRLKNYCPDLTKIKIPSCEKSQKKYPTFCAPNFKHNTFLAYKQELAGWQNCIADKLDRIPLATRRSMRQPLKTLQRESLNAS